MFDDEKQEALNKKHANDPQPGDYWQEHFCGVCVVLGVARKSVIYCKEREVVEGNRWTWDLDKTETKTIEEFAQWLSYGSIEGYWADVFPGAHKWVLGAGHKYI